MSLELRHIKQIDIEKVVELERISNEIDGNLLNPWTLTADQILKIVGQNQQLDKGIYETRVWVVEDETKEIVGSLAVEYQPTSFNVVFNTFIANRENDVLKTCCDFLKAKVRKSSTRKSIVICLRDSDNANLRILLPFWKLQGFQTKLIPNYFENSMDAWQCTYTENK